MKDPVIGKKSNKIESTSGNTIKKEKQTLIDMNPGYFPLAATALKRNKYPCFYIFPLEFGGAVISTNIRTVGLCAKTAIILQLENACVSMVAYT